MTPLFDKNKPVGKGNDPKFRSIFEHITQDGNRTLYISYRDHRGKTVRKKVFVKTPTDAKRFLEKTKEAVRIAKEKIARENVSLKAEDYLPAGVGRPASEAARMQGAVTVADIIDHHMSERVKKSRGANSDKDRKQLHKHFGPILSADASRVSRGEIEACLDGMKRAGIGNKTINNMMKALRAVYNRATKDDKATTNPTEHIEAYKVTQPERKRLEVDEVDAVLQTAWELGDRRLYLFLHLLARTGARPESIMQLQGKDLDFDKKIINIEALKGGKRVPAPMIGTLEEELAALELEPDEYAIHKIRTGGFYQPDRKAKGDYESLRRQADRLFDHHFGTSDHRTTLYTLRHSAATQLHKAGIDIATVSRLLGHRDIKTTMIYTEIDGDTIRDAIDKAGIWNTSKDT